MVEYWVIDVDGTMTDGGIYYDEYGNEMKKFNTRDAAGFFAANKVGMKIIVITGRECKATELRMKEMKVDQLFQNVKDKYTFLYNYLNQNHIESDKVGYIGDDLNDLKSMSLASYIACPSDSCKEILRKANYISKFKGGEGVVRDVIETYLSSIGQWENVIEKIYLSGT